MPTVSVIIPCYNRGQFISETIDSVLNQTFEDFEVFCIDDGSTDETREVLQHYGNQITVLEHDGRVNKGQSAAINLGIRHARGEYIGVLDSDDLWYPDKLSQQVAFFDENPYVDIVYGNGQAINEHGNRLYEIYGPEHRENNEVNELLLNCYFLLPNNALVRSRLYEAAGYFDESLRAAQDHDMLIRLAEVGNVAYVNRPWFKYRRHANSISSQNADLRWRNGFRILNAAARRYPYPKSVVRRRRAVLRFRLAQCFAERRQYGLALFNAVLSGMLDPLRAIRVILGRERITSPH